jgi:hypothetical protein
MADKRVNTAIYSCADTTCCHSLYDGIIGEKSGAIFMLLNFLSGLYRYSKH